MQTSLNRDCQGLWRRADEFHVVGNGRSNPARERGTIFGCGCPFDRERQDRQCLLWVEKEVSGDDDLMEIAVDDPEFDGYQLAPGHLVDASLQLWVNHGQTLTHDARWQLPFRH